MNNKIPKIYTHTSEIPDMNCIDVEKFDGIECEKIFIYRWINKNMYGINLDFSIFYDDEKK